MHCVFKKPKKDDVTGVPTDDFDTEDVYQASRTYTATTPDEIDEAFLEVFQTISAKFQDFQREGSGWTLDHVVNVEVTPQRTIHWWVHPTSHYRSTLLTADPSLTSRTTTTSAFCGQF